MNLKYVFCLVIITFNAVTTTNGCYGCLELDAFNFYKIIRRFEVVLVKFDIALPFGEKHDAFTELAHEIVDNKHIILALVGIKEYGTHNNKKFAKKFGVNSIADLPILKLFIQGESEPVTFHREIPWNYLSLKEFVRYHTNIYLGLPGCLEVFDEFAKQFTKSYNKEKKKVLEEAETEAKKIKIKREQNIANKYIKFMKKILKNGYSFITEEISRLKKLRKDIKIKRKQKKKFIIE